ncbi:MAG: glycosyltransferase family 39 protein [Candidatus Kapabacteria bacterium]|nr:glycosyltransferase family 39 protein [Candidatus Kapabacteria bacterium]
MNTSATLHDVRRQRLLILAVGLLLFIPFLGSVRLFDWDEINFAECAREMIATGDYLHMQIDYRPFTEKPPLFVWMQALSMHVFGINEFAARLPNAIVGVITLLVLHHIGRRIGGSAMGVLWPMVYLGTLLPHFYARSGIIDPTFNLFIFLSIWQIIRGQLEGKGRPFQAGLYASLAVMTKGPVGLGLVVLTALVMWIWQRRSTAIAFPIRDLAIITVTALTLPAVWLGIDAMQNGPTFLLENIHYQWRLLTTGEAGHAQPWYYHSIVLLIGCYPSSVFFFGGLRAAQDETADVQRMRQWMTALFFVVLVVFSAVTTKIVHYSSMAYIPLTYLAAMWIVRRGLMNTGETASRPYDMMNTGETASRHHDMMNTGETASRHHDMMNTGETASRHHDMMNTGETASRPYRTPYLTSFIILAHSFLLGGIAIIVPLAFMHSEWMLSLPSFRDPFLREAMSRNVEWLGVEPLIGLVLIAGAVVNVILRKRKPLAGLITLYASVMVFVFTFLPLVAPKIEAYSQGAALDFYQSLRGKDVYVKPLTMKSYAHLFYTQKPYHLSSAAKGIAADDWEPWLINGDIDRRATFVCRINDATNWSTVPTLRERYRDGGFIIYERVTSSERQRSRSR